MNARAVIDRRRNERRALLDKARAYVETIGGIDLVAAIVFGSVARGDFNRWSDIDLLLVAADLPDNVLRRLELVEPRPAGIEPVMWTPVEWQEQSRRANPIATEALNDGVWLVGDDADPWVTGPGGGFDRAGDRDTA